MNTLRLEIINLHAPYRVKQREDKPQHYYFRTDYGVEYDICLEEDFSIVSAVCYTAYSSFCASDRWLRVRARWW